MIEPDQRATSRLTLGFVLLGTLAATVRFVLCFPIWPDEAFLAISIARADIAGVLGPLEYHQVAPPFFLLIEESVTTLFGFNEWSLRIVPFLAAIGSLFAFRAFAHRVLTGWSVVFAVGIFAVSYWLIRYSAEAKPYSLDVLISVLMLLLAQRCADRPGLRTSVPLSLLCLVSFGLSFPAVFIGGGVSVYLFALGVRARDRSMVTTGIATGLWLLTGFLLVYMVHTRAVASQEMDWMRGYWDRAFPPLPNVGKTALWLIGHLTGELVPYPVGGRTGASTLTFICCVVGAIAWIRDRRAEWLIVLGTALGLALVVAILNRYPFGAPTRCQLYLAPLICLLAGGGLGAMLPTSATRRARHARIVCFILVSVGLLAITRDIASPTKTESDTVIRETVRTLWTADADRPVLCLREDVGLTFSPLLDRKQTLLTSYLCNVHIYAHPGVQTDLSGGVDVVNYRIGDVADEALRLAWIRNFEQTHGVRLDQTMSLPCPDLGKRGEFRRLDVIEVLRFLPAAKRSDQIIDRGTIPTDAS